MTSIKAIAFVLALVAVSSSQPIEPRNPILDMVLKNALEELKPKLKDLQIPKQHIAVDRTGINITVTFDKGLIQHLDEFVVAKLTTNIIPLRVSNLTILLDRVKITGKYKLDGTVKLPELGGNIHVFGDGDAEIELEGIFFTIASDFVFENGKFQIPPNGLHGFDVYLQKSKVQLDKLLGGGENGEVLNKFLSILIPELVRDYKDPLFEYAREPMRCMINDYLAGNNTTVSANVN